MFCGKPDLWVTALLFSNQWRNWSAEGEIRLRNQSKKAMVGSVSFLLPLGSTCNLQTLHRGQGRTTVGVIVVVSECVQHTGIGALTVRSLSVQSREPRNVSDLRSRHEEPRLKDLSLVRRPRGLETVRALNSAQYRLEKEKERGSEQEEEDDDDLCPIECVREFSTQAEFDHLLEQAKEQGSLVVVDFFRTACGSCKYIEKGFVKLCKGAGNKDAHVIFLKHNVMDEYEEQSDVADRLRIKVVPLFHFYKDGVLVESFPTREKSRILEAICKHTDLTLVDLDVVGK